MKHHACSSAILRYVLTLLVVFSFAPGVAVSQEVNTDGLSIESETNYGVNASRSIPKVFGGVPVAAAAFAAVVGISRGGTKQIQCTGTLIERDVVLTAAHCVCSGINHTVSFGDKEGAVTTIAVKGSKHGLNACGGSLTNGLDIAVLLLIAQSTVTPIAIQDDVVVDRAKSYQVVGFGGFGYSNGHLVAGEKRETVVPSATNDCQGTLTGSPRTYADAFGCATGKELVAGAAGLGRDSCNGDSGGPILTTDQGVGVPFGSPGVGLRLAGTTSRATKSAHVPCGDGGIYVRLNANARQWIAQAAQQLRR